MIDNLNWQINIIENFDLEAGSINYNSRPYLHDPALKPFVWRDAMTIFF